MMGSYGYRPDLQRGVGAWFTTNFPPAPMGKFGNSTVVDVVPLDMLHLVNDHWYQFPPLNPLWHGILGFTIGILGVLALIGNLTVLHVFTTTRALKTPSNVLVVNLAFSDLCMVITQYPVMVINCYYHTWIMGPLGCDLYGITGSLFGNGSIWTMAMIAYDRYRVIVKGMAAKPLTYKRAIAMVTTIWTVAIVWTLLPLFGWNRYVPEGNMTSCSIDCLSDDWKDKSYILVYSSFVFFTPLLIILYSYFHIVRVRRIFRVGADRVAGRGDDAPSTVADHEEQMRDQAKRMNVESLRSDGKDAHAEIRLAKIALMTITLWFAAWTPYLVINYTGIFNKARITPLYTIWGSLFAKTHPRYRAALRKKCPCLFCDTDGKGSDGASVNTEMSTNTSASSESTPPTPA
ncbi:unnamed protein product [Darwinula stevensoni]|uniref:G-protein coupled receptors family 1 profile domain-containing protein n=1 Tax=Darwinula stevensoni TaxID=69355 RepID=A0A7R9A8E4_9CRUS|nr:unnamed protein product [Darwinula stevensoni]CAG0896356.1 unnamed protein product [Darwinula stevensoni]